MSDISTLTELLESTGSLPCYFDMGRRVVKLDRDSLVQFELTREAYPLPLQRQAWLGILLLEEREQKSEPRIWFIRYPLDEQGKLVFAARDELLHRLLESAGNDKQLQDALQDNPYAFRPYAERMASFHAKATLLLHQPPSRFYTHARDYFRGELGWEQWSFVGFQGIADIAVLQGMEGNQQILAAAIPRLPLPPLEALCHCLENEPIGTELAGALICRAKEALSNRDSGSLSTCLRGLALSPEQAPKLQLMQDVLTQPVARQSEILAAIAGRGWEILLHDEIREQYLLCLAENDQGQDLFDSLMSDLLFLPATRSAMLSSLRQPHRPKVLETAIGTFFDRLRKS